MRANGKIGSATCPFDVFAILHHDEFAVKLCVHKIDSVSVSIISVSSAILDDFDPINCLASAINSVKKTIFLNAKMIFDAAVTIPMISPD